MACALDPERTRTPRSNGKLSQPVREREKMVRVSGDATFWVIQPSLGGYDDPWRMDADTIGCYARCANKCRRRIVESQLGIDVWEFGDQAFDQVGRCLGTRHRQPFRRLSFGWV